MNKLTEFKPAEKGCLECGVEMLKYGITFSDGDFVSSGMYCNNKDCSRYGLQAVLGNKPNLIFPKPSWPPTSGEQE